MELKNGTVVALLVPVVPGRVCKGRTLGFEVRLSSLGTPIARPELSPKLKPSQQLGSGACV